MDNYKLFGSIKLDYALLSRYSERELDVREREGKVSLRKIGLGERMINWLFCRDSQRLERLHSYVNLLYEKPLQGLPLQAQKQFYRKIRSWGQIHFNLSKLSDSVLKTLSPYLIHARQAHRLACEKLIQEISKGSSLEKKEKLVAEVHHLDWKRRDAETKLAAALGIAPLSASGGVNGAKFGLGLDGKQPLTVIKENGKDTRPWFMTEEVLGQRRQAAICESDPRIAGAVAFMASEHFGFGIVPPTYTDENGFSVQHFVPDTIAADERVYGAQKLKDRLTEAFTSTEIELLQTKAIFNYLVGDLDGKDDKLRLKVYDGSILQIFETDNDNTFPAKSLQKSKDGQTLKKTHAWKKHRWANRPLICEAGSKLSYLFQKILDPNEMDSFILKVNSKYPGFLTGSRLNLMKERLAILMIAYNKKMSLAELGEIYSLEYFEKPSAAFKRGHFIENYVDIVKNFSEEFFSPLRGGPDLDAALFAEAVPFAPSSVP